MIYKVYETKRYRQKIPMVLAVNQQLLLMPIGDIHFGSNGFPLERFKTHIEWGMDRGATFIGMGEYLDFTSASQRGIIGQLRDEPRKQMDEKVHQLIDELGEILKPTVGHWIGLIEGDHRWEFRNSISADQYLCQFLGCDFLGTSALVRLKMGIPHHPEADTILYVHHGIGSSRTAGGHLHRVEDLLKFIDADIYLMGHSHAKLVSPIDRQHISPDGIHYHRTKVIGRTGAWLLGYLSHEPLGLEEPAFESRGSYVEQKAYVPSSLGGLCIGIGHELIHESSYYRPTIHTSS